MLESLGSISDRADRVRVAQPGVLPRFAGIGGFVNAVAGNHVAADVCLAGADINNLGIGRRNGDRADAGTGPRQLAIRNVFPLGAIVVLFQTPPPTVPA